MLRLSKHERASSPVTAVFRMNIPNRDRTKNACALKGNDYGEFIPTMLGKNRVVGKRENCRNLRGQIWDLHFPDIHPTIELV